MLTKQKHAVLVKEICSVGIHGVTGQQVEEGDLQPGTLIKNVRVHEDGYESTIYRFDASTDGGKLWYTQQSYSKPVTK